MADLPRVDDLFDLFVREAVAAGGSVTEEAFRTAGTDANAIAAACATVAEEVVHQIAVGARDSLLKTLPDNDSLDRFIFDHFADPSTGKGLERQDATAAIGTLTFTRSAPGAAGQIAAGFRVASDTGIEVETTDDLNFTGAQTTLSVGARAVVAGSAGNVLAGKLTQLRSTPFDETFTATNAAAFAGGQERETGEQFKSRARMAWKAMGRGVLPAIEFGALQVPGIGMARATTVNLTDSQSHVVGKWISLVVADRNGRSNASLAALARTAMVNWACGGEYVEVFAATPIDQYVTVTCSFRAGANTSAAAARIRAAIVDLINGLKIGEGLRKDAIYEVVRADPDVATNSVTVSAPSGNVSAASTEVLRASLETVMVNPV